MTLVDIICRDYPNSTFILTIVKSDPKQDILRYLDMPTFCRFIYVFSITYEINTSRNQLNEDSAKIKSCAHQNKIEAVLLIVLLLKELNLLQNLTLV